MTRLAGKTWRRRADQGVAGDEVHTEPRDECPVINGIQPERDFRQFHCHRIEVHAEHVVVGNEHLHLLLFPAIFVMRDDATGFALLAVEVGFSELIDGFVGERATAKGHFANGEVEDVVGFLVLEQFLEGIFDEALGQDFGCVVGG